MKEYFYLVHIQYLGFRFHGWQKQPKLKTIHLMVDKTLRFVFNHDEFKTLGSSRTDSKVSANHSAFELFLKDPIDLNWFLEKFNSNLPNDIRAIKIEEVDRNFNIINTPKLKEYVYLFCYGEKPHPFTASIMTHFSGELDIILMQKGALLFEGEHNFVRYCTKPTADTQFERKIVVSKIKLNTDYTANFFPTLSYSLHLHSKGFMRYQVRLIVAQLVRLGRYEITLEQLQESLLGKDTSPLKKIAPGSGLILNKITFDK